MFAEPLARVPSIAGMNAAEAIAALAGEGLSAEFAVGDRTIGAATVDSRCPDAVVLEQAPLPDAGLKKGSVVALTLETCRGA